jgi:hypothetical protein
MLGRVAGSLAILLLFVGYDSAETITTHPWPGVTFEREVRVDPAQRIFVITVDLGDPHIHLRVSRGGGDAKLTLPWEVTLMPVSQMAARDGLAIAVNGNLFAGKDYQDILGFKFYYFAGNWARACGWAMSDGKLFSEHPLDPDWPSLVVDDAGRAYITHLKSVPENARQIVSGIWQIVGDGRETALYPGDDAINPAPHTAVALDREGKTLTIFVVDGRRSDYSAGMSWRQIAQELLARHAWDAILLDGGGSTTLVMRNSRGEEELINRPSDGHDLPMNPSMERSVACALGVVIDGATTRGVEGR